MSISKLVVTNLEKWVDLNRNRATTQNIMKNDSQIKIYYIGDGDERNYFHMQEAEELYFVFSGELVLRCLDSTGVSKDVHIMAGEVFLLPAKILHSVKYCENLSAIVIERERLTNEIDNLSWYAIIQNSNQKDSKFNDTIDNTNKNTSINLSDDILSYNTKQSVDNIASSDKSLTFGAPLVNRSPSPDPNAIKSIVSDSMPYTMQSQSTEALDHKTQQSADTAPRNMNTHFSDSQPLRKKDNLATNFRIGSDEDMDIPENNQAKNETILIDTDHALNTDSSPPNVRSDLNVKSYSQPRCMLSTQQNAYKLKQTQSLNPLLNNTVGLIGTDILCEPIPENEPLPPSPKPSVISTDHQNTQQYLSPTSSLQSTVVNIYRTGISSSVQPPQKIGQTKFFKPQPPHFSLLTKSESATNFGGSTLNSTTQQNMYNYNVNLHNQNQMSPFVPLNALKKRSPSLISNAENYHCTPGPCMKLLTQTWFHCIDTFRDIDHALQIMKLRENKRATENPQPNTTGTNTGSCTIHHPEERLTKYPNFVGDTLPADASIGYKPCSDLEDNIHPPVAFDLWIDRRMAEINTTGCVSLFDEDDYQVKVLVYGSGEHIGRNNAADIFVWQYKGSCVLSLNVNTTTANNTNTSSGGDNKKDVASPNYTLNMNDTLIVPRGTSYTAINTMDGLTLHIVIDPRKKT